jgi:hypothetical protein
MGQRDDRDGAARRPRWGSARLLITGSETTGDGQRAAGETFAQGGCEAVEKTGARAAADRREAGRGRGHDNEATATGRRRSAQGHQNRKLSRAVRTGSYAMTEGQRRRRKRPQNAADIRSELYPQAVRNAVDEQPAGSFHVKRSRWIMERLVTYPQGGQAFYVAFHVKRWRLWITSVDNFECAAMPTDGDLRPPGWGCLNG